MYCKENGKWVWYKFRVGYEDVYTEKIECNDGVYMHYVHCYDPGDKKCKVSRPINYQACFSISSPLLNSLLNDAQDNLLGLIEKDIVDGAERGSKSQTICHNYNGINYYFVLKAVWVNGDSDGNGEVRIDVIDITREIGL